MILKEIFSNKEFIFTGRFLLSSAKDPKVYLFRTVLLIILIVLMTPFTLRQTSTGINFFKALVSVNFFYITIYCCTSFSSLISSEKEQGTLGLLMMTPRHPVSLIAAKSVPVFSEVMIYFLLELPILLISVALGGIDPKQIPQIMLLLPFHALFIDVSHWSKPRLFLRWRRVNEVH